MFKKLIIILSIVIFASKSAYSVTNADLVRSGISKYKAKNYAGCVCTMKDVIKKDPSNVTAHYYAAIAYARLGNKTEATEYYNKVVSLNSNATMTSYAKQGLAALTGSGQYNTQNAQADKFLQAGYKSGVNPDITKQMKLMKLEREKDEINSRVNAPKITAPADTTKDGDNKTDTNKKSQNTQPTDAEIAQAVKTLAAAGINPLQLNMGNGQQNIDPKVIQQYSQGASELAQLQMMLGTQNNNNYNNNNMMNYLPYLMQQQQNGGNNPAMSREFIQTMMMTQMMPDFSFDTSSKR